MQIKTLTWNIGGGKLLEQGADPNLMASYTKDGIDSIIALLKSENADIITLQETQSNETVDQVQTIADALGYTYVRDVTSDSHIDPGHTLGHAILTRHNIVSHDHGLFTNPNVQIEWEDGSKATSFDKGYTTCVLDINGQTIAVTTLHLIPFRRFNIDLLSDTAKSILNDVQTTIATARSPWLIMGDFNIDDSKLKPYLPILFTDTTTEMTLDQPTTPKNDRFDHIILRDGTILNHHVIPDVLTDHYPVVADITI